jgi:large subunit ribosomal protein L4
MLLGALRSALSAKLTEQRLTVVEDWELENHKTKEFLGVLGKLNHKKSALIVAHGENTNLERASRNIEGVTLVAPNGLQPYDLLKHDLLVLSKEAVARLSHSLDPEKAPAATPDVETIAPAPKREAKTGVKPAAVKKPKAAAKKPAKTAKKKGKE